jgi:hypothetical protein
METPNPTTEKLPEWLSAPISLLGHFFHAIGEFDHMESQGVVIGNPEPGWYLVMTFEWLMGEPSVRHLARIEDMERWLFYENQEDMKFSYEHGVARAGGKYRKNE